MGTQYDGSDVSVIFAGMRIEQLQSVSTPDVSYPGEYDRTLGDDDDVFVTDDTPEELEGELVVAPTSGSIDDLEQHLHDRTIDTLTIRFPPDHSQSSETYSGTALTERSDEDFDGDDSDDRTYSFVSEDIE
ncbi:head protein [Natrialba phage PhiCh1]|uniref:Capsid protein gpA/gpH n=2 Tax=root TaxID=1 RepID=D3T2G7_NATMM|nr:hypothetical protein [Natrialba magadii]NP_665937.1 head protein [Natrialba phage PhiCh1]YP_010078049.1 head protein [Natrialba phage PhiCh1]AAM88693.1 capsid protein gpA/H [Natrialba phage PhiCh1]ADD07776.1 capsid protein gpA/gpH [Natrialba magadii ATCC 43099]ELY23023.1 hypothetical protein C500_21205 [Natrialba magadii ATCC 43099]QBJ01200.1 capsid protein [Natrialba phage PhiCh1]